MAAMIDKRKKVANIFGRIARISLIVFGVCLALCFLLMSLVQTYEAIVIPILVVCVPTLLISGPVHICSLIARDVITLGYVRWQFSVRGMLTMMTLAALFLGSIGVLINYLRR
jgi:hypothetical protein